MQFRTLLTIAALLTASPLALAAPHSAPLATINVSAEIAELTTAYVTLSKADHDYKGHRAEAMHQIEKACDALGTDIRDKGKGHETQTLSDDQLREARRQVAEVRDASKIANQKEVTPHLEEAVRELDIALTIK